MRVGWAKRIVPNSIDQTVGTASHWRNLPAITSPSVKATSTSCPWSSTLKCGGGLSGKYICTQSAADW